MPLSRSCLVDATRHWLRRSTVFAMRRAPIAEAAAICRHFRQMPGAA